MIVRDITKLQEMLAEALGEDLVISLARDVDKYYLAISVHKSDRVEYSHGGNIQSCLIRDDDFDKDVEDLVKQIVPLYEEVLVEREENVV